jgi:hypothetical protein
MDRADLLARLAETPEWPTKEVEAPELGGSLLVRAMTGTVRNRLEAALAAISEGADGKCMDSVVVALVSECVVDDKGHPILPKSAAEKLFRNYPTVAFRIRDAAVELGGTSETDKEELKEAFG